MITGDGFNPTLLAQFGNITVNTGRDIVIDFGSIAQGSGVITITSSGNLVVTNSDILGDGNVTLTAAGNIFIDPSRIHAGDINVQPADPDLTITAGGTPKKKLTYFVHKMALNSFAINKTSLKSTSIFRDFCRFCSQNDPISTQNGSYLRGVQGAAN